MAVKAPVVGDHQDAGAPAGVLLHAGEGRYYRRPNDMNAYLVVTAALFGLITLAHVARMLDEGAGLARDPWYLLLTAAAAALCIWALRLLRLRRRP